MNSVDQTPQGEPEILPPLPWMHAIEWAAMPVEVYPASELDQLAQSLRERGLPVPDRPEESRS